MSERKCGCDGCSPKNDQIVPDAESIVTAQLIISRVLAGCIDPFMRDKDYLAARQSIAETVQRLKTKPPFVLVVRRHGIGWIAYLKSRPGTWEYGRSRTEAIGALMETYCIVFQGILNLTLEVPE